MKEHAARTGKTRLLLVTMTICSFLFAFGCIEAIAAVYGHTGALIKSSFDLRSVSPSAETNKNQPPDTSYPKPEQSLTDVKDGAVHLVALGDSLTRGVGDLSGKGYIGIVKDALTAQTGKPTVFVNLAVSGQTSAQLDSMLEGTAQNSLLHQATLIVFTIGGNDLFGSTQQLQNISNTKIEAAQKRFETHLRSILLKIRAANPTVPVYLVGIYNPFYEVLAPDLHADQYVSEFNQTMVDLSQQVPGVHVIPIYDLFQRSTSSWLASDFFHPNQTGYERIAARVMQDLAAPVKSGS